MRIQVDTWYWISLIGTSYSSRNRGTLITLLRHPTLKYTLRLLGMVIGHGQFFWPPDAF